MLADIGLQADRHADKQTHRHTDRQTNAQTDGLITILRAPTWAE